MNFILVERDDFVEERRVRLQGRRFDHVHGVLGCTAGDEVRIGVIGGMMGRGRIESIDENACEIAVCLESEPPAPLPLRLILALPRPKVFNRTIAAAASLGIREIDLINSWRVEKAYWQSPRLSEQNIRIQSILGLEQAGDTILPAIRIHRLFTPFVRRELPEIINGRLALLAHPRGQIEVPRHVMRPAVLAIGPEGGFIDREVETFQDVGFTSVCLGPRILRVETAMACLVGRLF